MLKKSTFAFITMLITMLLLPFNAIKAGSVRFNFTKNPWNLPKAGFGAQDNEAKLEDDFEINQDGFILTNKKVNETKWNRLKGDYYEIYTNNKIVITAPEGKQIVRIEFQAANQYAFDLTNDEGVRQDESSSWDDDFGSDANDPVVFRVKGNKATFTGGSSVTRLIYIEVVYKDVPTTPIEIVFDFKDNFQDSWGITNVAANSSNPQEGKIEDGQEINQDGVVFTTKNNRRSQVTRVKGGTLYLPPTHTLTFNAPEGKIIKSIEFTFVTAQSFLAPEGGENLKTTNKVGTYTGDVKTITFVAPTIYSKINKIVVTVAPDVTAGISSVTSHRLTNGKVYNLNGVVVGTEKEFNNLAKGIYILNGKKVVKN